MPLPEVGVAEMPAGAAATALLEQRRLSFALRSAAGVLLAIAFLWPAIGEAMLIRLFAGYAFLDGILILAAGGWSARSRCLWPLLVVGCADIVASVAAYAWSGIWLTGLVILMAVWAIVVGASFTVGATVLRQVNGGYLLLLCGIAAGLFARALLSYTGGDVVVIATWVGLYALTQGILLFKLSLRLYGFAPVEVSAQRGGLFAFRAIARSRRRPAR